MIKLPKNELWQYFGRPHMLKCQGIAAAGGLNTPVVLELQGLGGIFKKGKAVLQTAFLKLSE